MNPEGEFRPQHRAPRLRTEAIQLVRQGIASGAIRNLTPKQQFILYERYAHWDDKPPTQEELAARLYGSSPDSRRKKANISSMERTGLRRLDKLLNQSI